MRQHQVEDYERSRKLVELAQSFEKGQAYPLEALKPVLREAGLDPVPTWLTDYPLNEITDDTLLNEIFWRQVYVKGLNIKFYEKEFPEHFNSTVESYRRAEGELQTALERGYERDVIFYLGRLEDVAKRFKFNTWQESPLREYHSQTWVPVIAEYKLAKK